MPCHRCSLLVVLLFLTDSYCQQANPLQQIYDRYKNFDYQGVIKSGDEILKTAGNLNRQDSLDIFRLQGLSYYSMADMSGALHCFVSVLRLEPDYRMSERENPPKVINFFEGIRRDLIKPEAGGLESSASGKKYPDVGSEMTKDRNRSIGYSLIVPGWGHLKEDQTRKGWILLASGLVTLGSSVYFTLDTNRKEDAYLGATLKDEIDKKYDAYNQAYKLRNGSLLLYAGLWVYTQMDLLFGSNPAHPKITFYPETKYPVHFTWTMQFTF